MEKSEQLKWEIVCTGNEVLVSDIGIKIKELYGGFGQGQKILTVQQIAQLHVDDPSNKNEVRTKTKRINELINNNIQGFVYDIDIIDLKKHNVDITILKQIYPTQNTINRSVNLYILSSKGYCKLYNIMRIKDVVLKGKILKQYFNCDVAYDDSVTYKEIDFKNTYEKRINVILKKSLETAWNIDILELKNIINNNYHIPKHQYSVCDNKYQIDFYFEKLRIIVEYDEYRHKYQVEQDNKRMDEIVQFLSLKNGDCGFNNKGILCDIEGEPINTNNCDYYIIRIKENDNNGVDKLVGLVLGRIFSLC